MLWRPQGASENTTKGGPEVDNRTGKSAGFSTDQHDIGCSERRQAVRYPLRDAHGKLSWSEGSERVTCEMTVVNISGGGAAVLADSAPPANQTVWFYLQNRIVWMESVESQLVATSTDPSGKHLVRVRFKSWISLDGILEKLEERRSWQRYPAQETRATLFWYDQDVQRMIRGQLLNISGGGAAIITDINPPADQSLWFGLESDALPIVPVEARRAGILLDTSGSQVVRLCFVNSCPMEVFELAVNGPH